MPRAKSRVFDDRYHDRGGELRPYFFERDASDVLEEAFDALLRQRLSAVATAAASDGYERDVLREQRWTLFAFDEIMQRMFGGDFEAFCTALDDPQRMHERVREWFRRAERASRRSASAMKERRQTWDGNISPARQWEASRPAVSADNAGTPCATCGNVHEDTGDDHPASLDEDPIYDAAFRWACRTDRWSRRLAVGERIRDRDLFRVLVNATLVPAKVAFGSPGAIDCDLPGIEVAAIGYRQAAAFLIRTLDSLANCHAKRIGRPQTVHALMDEGREILADIESKLADIEAEIRSRSENP